MSKVIYLEKNDIHATLCTWLYCHFWMLWSAEQQGVDGYINWSPKGSVLSYYDKEMFAKEPNQFLWYFKQPKVEYAARTEVWTWESWKDESPVGFMAQPLSVIKDYYKKHLHFSDAVEEGGWQLVKKYNIDFTKTIGITWRGTDNVTDGRPRLSIETYFPFIDEVLTSCDMRIMCTAEEDCILNPLLKRYNRSFTKAFVIEEFFSSPCGHSQNPERFSPMSGFERGMQPALMVWLFSKCAHYIKNRSSTGAVASWLSDGRIVSLGHPENLGFPANTDTAEIEGKLYPLYV